MIPHVIVIDDFLPNAQELRERALKLTYAVEGRFPGLNSVEKITIPGLDELISRLVYEPVQVRVSTRSMAATATTGSTAAQATTAFTATADRIRSSGAPSARFREAPTMTRWPAGRAATCLSSIIGSPPVTT
jgi:hypothetical protein